MLIGLRRAHQRQRQQDQPGHRQHDGGLLAPGQPGQVPAAANASTATPDAVTACTSDSGASRSAATYISQPAVSGQTR